MWALGVDDGHVGVDFGPEAVVGCGMMMRQRDEGQDATGVGESIFERF